MGIQQHISQKYGQDSIKKDGLLGDQTLSAVIQAARLGDSEAIQFAQKYGISYSSPPSSFGISGGSSKRTYYTPSNSGKKDDSLPLVPIPNKKPSGSNKTTMKD